MRKTIRRIAVPVSLFFILTFVVIVVGQTAQVVQLAKGIHPVFGDGVLWGIILLYSALLLVPVTLFLRLPGQLKPPAQISSPEFPSFLAALKKRLSRNSRLTGVPLNTQEDVKKAIGQLDDETNRRVREVATTVFLGTALSPNGQLDALIVLSAQSRMIWQVAHIYNQRPSLREIAQLYGNVAGTVLIAMELDEILEENIEPLIGSIFGGSIASIPGAGYLASSLLSGASNAFMTLRIGMIAKRYCNCLTQDSRKGIRKAATGEAAGLLASVVGGGVKRLSRSLLKGPKKMFDQFLEKVQMSWTNKPKTAESS